ncbi:hypothetical protein GBAR_LOCUS15111, partial [Geodia barretti]
WVVGQLRERIRSVPSNGFSQYKHDSPNWRVSSVSKKAVTF